MKDEEIRRIIKAELEENKVSILYTPEQVSELLNISIGTLRNWRNKGIGPKYIKLNNSSAVRYPKEYYEDYIRMSANQ